MHHHGYLWTGPKPRFDEEALRRPPHAEPPAAGSRPELVQRYREMAAGFPISDLPPLETAYWLVKPGSLVRGTWGEPKEAAVWLGERMVEYMARFGIEEDRQLARISSLVDSTALRLDSGGDVSLGFYLERPSYLSLAVVTCSPNRSRPGLTCPVR
ncbi:hypothetical protein ACQEWB_18825 [Streptomyces sp. CA-249302]|uniref:hypothetical protein n=1 Tax=Streptomyces sp. CA-249302 TaxID=3240058 RepID=UPI003D8ECF4E